MNESQKLYIKWKKPDRIGYILYYLTDIKFGKSLQWQNQISGCLGLGWGNETEFNREWQNVLWLQKYYKSFVVMVNRPYVFVKSI